MRYTQSLLGFALCLSVSHATAQEADAVKHCVECHGTNGLGTKPGMPHLDGQMATYLVDALRAYNGGVRKTAVPQHKGLSHDATKAAAEYYAAQKATREKSPTDPELVAKGDDIYLKRCADCHPDNGREADKDAPLMAAQNLDYLIAQSLAFRKGERRFATMMDDAYKGLSDADLTAVSHFFASQDQFAPKAKKRKRK
jgi:sulfide dehydrogenase cytochrome subunit